MIEASPTPRLGYPVFLAPARDGLSAAEHFAMAAVLVELCIGSNLLTLLGSRYVSEGGSLAEKLHPGTYLAYGAALLALTGRRGGTPLLWRQRELAIFMGGMLGCALFAAMFTGSSNLIVLFDNFLPAGCLALAFSESKSARARLRWVLQLGFVANALLGVGEFVAGSHLLPLYLNGVAATELPEDFRPIALYDHPLTGATATLLGFFLLPFSRYPRRRMLYALALGAGLLAFGGRAALAIGLLAVSWHIALRVRLALSRKRPPSGWTVARIVLLFASAATVATVILTTGLAGRLAHHGYWDASAQSRLLQWQILGFLDTQQLLFGVSRPDLLADLEMLRLSTGIDVIENFALLMFATLGFVGFVGFATALAWLFVWCWRRSGQSGRLLTVCFLLAVSGSNSLGRKSTLLLLFTGTCVATWSTAESRP